MTLGTFLLIILVLVIFGGRFGLNWGAGPTGGLGLVLIIVLILVLMGRL